MLPPLHRYYFRTKYKLESPFGIEKIVGYRSLYSYTSFNQTYIFYLVWSYKCSKVINSKEEFIDHYATFIT